MSCGISCAASVISGLFILTTPLVTVRPINNVILGMDSIDLNTV